MKTTRPKNTGALAMYTSQVVFALSAAAALTFGACAYASPGPFTLSSPDLTSGTFDKKFVLHAFGCTGDNVSPKLEWDNAPAGTNGFAVQLIDLDAPTGSGLWHWSVYNIPGNAHQLAQGAGNAAASLPAPAFGGNTDFVDTGVAGANGNYAGPCPAAGDKPHRFQFTVYAYSVPDLQAAGGVPKTGTAGLYSYILNKGLGANLLGKASFIATYGH